jgi:uncharacterized RDD family membrane protein YckC
MAFVIDVIIIAALLAMGAALLQVLISFFGAAVRRAVSDISLGVSVMSFAFLFQLVYFVFFWSVFGQTPGKFLLGLRVVRTDGSRLGVGRSALRFLCYWVSLIPLGLGFLWVLVDRRRQGWHDKIASTHVLFTAEAAAFHRRVERAQQSADTQRPAG